MLDVDRLDRAQLVDHALRRRILPELQIAVQHVIEGVVFVRSIRHFGRGAIRLDRLLPGADAREDVRRHVAVVCRRRRDARVPPK